MRAARESARRVALDEFIAALTTNAFSDRFGTLPPLHAARNRLVAVLTSGEAGVQEFTRKLIQAEVDCGGRWSVAMAVVDRGSDWLNRWLRGDVSPDSFPDVIIDKSSGQPKLVEEGAALDQR